LTGLLRALYALVILAAFLILAYPGNEHLAFWVYGVAAVFWIVVAPLWLVSRPSYAPPPLALAAGPVVLIPAFCALIELRSIDPWLLLGVMALVWISDSAAYFTGKRYGRRKLAPAVSPGKTWEGAFGGVTSAALYALIVVLVTHTRGIGVGPAVIIALVLAIAGIIGDLLESHMKRAAGVKDSGTILPGHGGVLDRVDALTAALPLAALALRI
jgi:phosphatidate cytidylyltransferase